MKKNQKDPLKENEHGVISIVQSPDKEENKSDETEKHGIISIVQSPDEETTKKEND